MMRDNNDVDKSFTEDFRKYVQRENLRYWHWWMPFYVFEKAPAAEILEWSSLIHSLISFFRRVPRYRCIFLLQFWAAEQVVVNTIITHNTNYRLTTTNLPFLLGNFKFTTTVHEGLCRYRMKTCDLIVPGDGPMGRVFRNKRIESNPDVGYYSYEEYPLRDLALSCGIKHSIVAPWFDSDGKVVGVIEFVSPVNPNFFAEVVGYFNGYLSSSLGKGVDRCQGLCAQVRDGLFKKKDLEKNLLSSALSEIKEAVGVLFESRVIDFAQTWMLCNSCNSLSACQCYPDLLAFRGGNFSMDNILRRAGTSCKLQTGEGVVGKAAESSHNLVYCENVAKFSIIEYPLAHFARLYNLSACFALCLRSSYTGDQVYILEFFLSPGRVRDVDLRTVLVSILDLMKRKFRTFKVAYGREELGDRLHVLVTGANSPDNLETLICLETSSEDTSMGFSAPSVQSEFYVTIKANYGEDRFIRFQLLASSGIHELYCQLSQRLGLVDGTYDLKYRDEENDLIELTCDEDLRLFIRDSIKHEISTLTVFIVPK